MAGVETELDRMVRTATEAARIGDALKAVMTSLDSAMSSLTPMDGEIKNTFWQGHHNHLEAVDRLCRKLHGMSDGITTSKVAYESQDANSQQVFSHLGTGSAIDTTVL
ncbi:hypothetical protein [Kribbella sp. NPDC004536]|uniref:hypothetical protein n=1 Tax=Kribbella sp. NPDC004536 TaxID=3364106 RepID=UPI0036BD648D